MYFMKFNPNSLLVSLCLFLFVNTSCHVIAQPTCLNGSYTIGGTTPDFATFTNAVTELQTAGVCGPVVLDIRTGTYIEQISVPEIAGTSANNTITFQSESGINSDVILQFASSGTFNDLYYVVQLNGADYIRFQDITIERTGSSTYARVIDFSGSASYNVFDGNILTGRATGSTSNDNTAIIFSDEANSGIANNTFRNNEILYGFAGIVWDSSSGNSKPGLTVSNNTFLNYRYGLLIDYATDVVITGNTITNNPLNYNNAQLKGVECFRCEDALTISGNTITLTDGNTNYGIELQASVGSAGAVGDISNNMVIVGGTGTSQGINSGSLTSYKNYYHNSCYTTGANATNASAFYLNGSSNINIKNNAFAASVGNAMEILAETALTSDYNLLYSTGTYVGNWDGNHADLTAFQASNGSDANSISSDPDFIAITDLHISPSSPANATAATGLAVTIDIDGDTRDASTPDIGADEVGSVVTGLDEVENGFRVYVTQNNTVVVEDASGDNLNGIIEITDMAGRKVFTSDIQIADGVGRLQTTGFITGIYAITFVTANGDKNMSHKVRL